MSLKISKITIAWALYIIISSSFMRQVLNFLSQNLGMAGVSIMFGILFLVGGTAVFFYLFVAIIDETFQWWLRYRAGDVRDVLFAGIGGIWGISLFLISFNPVSNRIK